MVQRDELDKKGLASSHVAQNLKIASARVPSP